MMRERERDTQGERQADRQRGVRKRYICGRVRKGREREKERE